jgi:uroporphyrinogen decarboxylase
MDFGFWGETLVIWEEQGFPKGANTDEFFGMDAQWTAPPISAGLFPSFDYTILEEREETRIVRDQEGVTKEEGKFLGSIPKHIDHTLKDRASWEAEFVPRFNGKNPGRYPANWDELKTEYLDPSREYPLAIGVASLYGSLRDYMGVENISLLVYDDPALFEEMVSTCAQCVIDSVLPALESGIKFEFASFWEDMCYKNGPLLSPRVFQKVLVPNYKRITSMLRDFGIDVALVDCDGEISKLTPLFLEGGVNCMFPIEVGTWNADPIQMRAQYGKKLLMMGGVGKRMLASDFATITAEVERLAPLVEEGGFVPTPDHRVPPDVPLANYIHYLNEARRVWGRGLGNLRPMIASQA